MSVSCSSIACTCIPQTWCQIWCICCSLHIKCYMGRKAASSCTQTSQQTLRPPKHIPKRPIAPDKISPKQTTDSAEITHNPVGTTKTDQNKSELCQDVWIQHDAATCNTLIPIQRAQKHPLKQRRQGCSNAAMHLATKYDIMNINNATIQCNAKLLELARQMSKQT